MKTIWGLIPRKWKLILVSMAGIFYAPLWLQDKFDARWDAKAAPYIILREQQMFQIDKRLESMDKKLDILIGK